MCETMVKNDIMTPLTALLREVRLLLHCSHLNPRTTVSSAAVRVKTLGYCQCRTKKKFTFVLNNTGSHVMNLLLVHSGEKIVFIFLRSWS